MGKLDGVWTCPCNAVHTGMKPPSQRLLYLDWLRGIAAITMLQGHVFHSFLRNDLRTGGPYQMSQFAGGMPPAIFLFLLGVTFAFLMDSQERKGVRAGRRVAGGADAVGLSFRRGVCVPAAALGFSRSIKSPGPIFSGSTF